MVDLVNPFLLEVNVEIGVVIFHSSLILPISSEPSILNWSRQSIVHVHGWN